MRQSGKSYKSHQILHRGYIKRQYRIKVLILMKLFIKMIWHIGGNIAKPLEDTKMEGST